MVTVWPLALTLRACLPVPADGGVVQSGVVRRHLTAGVIKEDAHDLLRDVTVDQPGAEGVPPLVRREMHGSAVFVADVAAAQPVPQLAAVGVRGQGFAAVGVHLRGGEQPGAAVGPPAQDPLLLFSDGLLEFLVDGDQRLAFHLAVDVAQVGRAVAVADDAVERDLASRPRRAGRSA